MDSKKLTIYNDDAYVFLEKDKTHFYDVIIIDLPDPRSVELSRLYSQEFYSICKRRLRPNGFVITQAGSPYFATQAFNCINKTLLLKQQVCLLLKDVYYFKVSEIMQITNFTEGIVKHALADARKNMIRIFDDRCAFVNKKGVCHQCTALTGALNPKQNAHIKAQELKIVQEGNSTDKEYLLDLRLDLVKGIDP